MNVPEPGSPQPQDGPAANPREPGLTSLDQGGELSLDSVFRLVGVLRRRWWMLVVLPAIYRLWHRMDEPSPAAEEAIDKASIE